WYDTSGTFTEIEGICAPGSYDCNNPSTARAYCGVQSDTDVLSIDASPCDNRTGSLSCDTDYISVAQDTQADNYSVEVGDATTLTINLTGEKNVLGDPQPADIMQVLDKSGSMASPKIDTAKLALKNIWEYIYNFSQNNPQHNYYKMGFASFNQDPQINAYLDYVAQYPAFTFYPVFACGCTCIGCGINYSAQNNFEDASLSCQDGSVEQVMIIASDGQENVAPYLDDIKSTYASSDITFYTIGIDPSSGWANKLDEVSKWGTGKGAYFSATNVDGLYEIYKNIVDIYLSNQSASAIEVRLNLSDEFEFVSASIAPSYQNGSIVVWNIPGIEKDQLKQLTVTVNTTSGSGVTDVIRAANSSVTSFNKCGAETLSLTAIKADIQSSAVCGNGILEDGEECDDGNLFDGDFCNSTCQLQQCAGSCGDGILDPDEECDDGNTDNGDGCNATCNLESCTMSKINNYFPFSGSYKDYIGAADGLADGFPRLEDGYVNFTEGFLRFPSHSLSRPRGNSISFWVRPEYAHWHTIMGTDTDADNHYTITLRDNVIRAKRYNNNNRGLVLNHTIPMGSWTHVAITMEKPTSSDALGKLYIDGVLVDTDVWGIGFHKPYAEFEVLGAGINDGVYSSSTFNGSIDELMLFDDVLTVSEISTLASNRSFCPSLPVCGNGILEPGEQCDDGNNESNDGCTATCRLDDPCSDSYLSWLIQGQEETIQLRQVDSQTFEFDAPALNDTSQLEVQDRKKLRGDFKVNFTVENISYGSGPMERAVEYATLMIDEDVSGVRDHGFISIHSKNHTDPTPVISANYIENVDAHRQAITDNDPSTDPSDYTNPSSQYPFTPGTELRIERTADTWNFIYDDGTGPQTILTKSGAAIGNANISIYQARDMTQWERDNYPQGDGSWAPSMYSRWSYDIDASAYACHFACNITSVAWNQSNARQGDQVQLNVVTEGCTDGTTVNFRIWEDDTWSDDEASVQPAPATLTGNEAHTFWTAEWQNDCGGLCLPPEYYFIATIPEDNMQSGHLLTHNTCTPGEKRLCGDFIDANACSRGIQSCDNDGEWTNCDYDDPITEICGDNIDNDCDGSVDEQCHGTVEQCGVKLNRTEPYYCGDDDGVCPMFFEDAQGNRITCEPPYADPDCPDATRSISFQFNHPPQSSGIEEMSNTGAGTTLQKRENYHNGIYTAAIRISGDAAPTPRGSMSEINFTDSFTGGYLRTVLFDGHEMRTCAEADPDESCYTYDDTARRLRVYHPLSDHLLLVQFDALGFSLGLFLLVLLGVLIPIALIHYVRTHHHAHLHLDMSALTHRVTVPHDDYEKVKRYVKGALDQGYEKEIIRRKLLKHGWENHVIQMVFKDVHVKHKDVKKLEDYIRSAIPMGISKKEMHEGLKKVGWTKNEIDKAMKRIQEEEK
ncbi:MAG: LamG-like jellyroll fold domain-containing protein, partial [Nanoarchaeota archaeon]